MSVAEAATLRQHGVDEVIAWLWVGLGLGLGFQGLELGLGPGLGLGLELGLGLGIGLGAQEFNTDHYRACARTARWPPQ